MATIYELEGCHDDRNKCKKLNYMDPQVFEVILRLLTIQYEIYERKANVKYKKDNSNYKN